VERERTTIRQTIGAQSPKGVSALSWGNGKAGMVGRGVAMIGGALVSLIGTGITMAAAQ
jgi:hypothetical protein